jgi:hypothetical protein
MPHPNPITGCQDDGWLDGLDGIDCHDSKIDISRKVIKEFRQTLVEQIVKSNYYKVVAGKALSECADVN